MLIPDIRNENFRWTPDRAGPPDQAITVIYLKKGQPQGSKVFCISELETKLRHLDDRRAEIARGARTPSGKPYSSKEKDQVYCSLGRQRQVFAAFLRWAEKSDPNNPLVLEWDGNLRVRDGQELLDDEVEWRRLVRKKMPSLWNHPGVLTVRAYFYSRRQGGQISEFEQRYGEAIDGQSLERFIRVVSGYFSSSGSLT